MNAKERRKYQREYDLINRRFTKKWTPKIFKAVNSLVSSLIEDIQRQGLRQAMGNLSMTLINDKLFPPISEMYKDVGLFHAKRTYRSLQAEIGRKALNRSEMWVEEIIQYLRNNLLQYAVVKPTETLRNQLLLILERGIQDGMGEDELVKLIRDSNLAVVQSQRIVRTEINRAANSGNLVAAQSFDYELSKEWIAHRDMRTRGVSPKDKNDHYHMDGKVVDLDEDFKDPRSGENISHPSAPGGSAGMVINCRCSFATVPKRDDSGRLIRKPNRNITVGRFFDNAGSGRRVELQPIQSGGTQVLTKPVFKPAATIKEAEDWARKNLLKESSVERVVRENQHIDEWLRIHPTGVAKRPIDVSYKGMPLEVANEVNKRLFANIIEAGLPKLNRIESRPIKKEKWAARMSNSGDLELNSSAFKKIGTVEGQNTLNDFKDSIPKLEELRKSGRLTRQQEVLLDRAKEMTEFKTLTASKNNIDIITHEVGHHLDNNLSKIIQDRGLDKTEMVEILKKAFVETTQNNEHKYNLSYYAFEDLFAQRAEVFAEAFTLYKNGGVNRLSPNMKLFFDKIFK